MVGVHAKRFCIAVGWCPVKCSSLVAHGGGSQKRAPAMQQYQEQSGAADWKKFQSFRKTVSRLLHKGLCVLIKYQTVWLRLLTGIITSNHIKTCIWMYAPTLHIIIPDWKPSRLPSAEVKHTNVLLIHKKINKLQIWAWTALSERSLSQKRCTHTLWFYFCDILE